MESIRFEFTNLSCFRKLDKNHTGGAHYQCSHSDRTPDLQTAATAILAISPSCHRRSYRRRRFSPPIKAAHGRAENPFRTSPLPRFALTPCSAPLPPPSLFAGEHNHRSPPPPSEMTRRTTIFSSPPSSSSRSSPSTVVPRRSPAQPRLLRAPPSSSAAHRPEVPLQPPLIHNADDRLSATIFLTVDRPPL
jgi:hypothetical protein